MTRTPEQAARAEKVLNLWHQRATAGDPLIGHIAAELGIARDVIERILKLARAQGDERAITTHRSRAASRPAVIRKSVKPRVHNFAFLPASDVLAQAGDRPPHWHLCGDDVINGEEWSPVQHPAGYHVSNLGRVRGRRGQLLRSFQNNGEYRRIRLGSNDPDSRHFLVHVLVAQAFIGMCPDGMEVNHRDGVQYHNLPANLEYVTPGGNVRHANAVLGVYRNRGSRVNTAKLTEQQALDIAARYAAGEASQYELARQYGVSQGAIQRLVAGKSWRHAAVDLASPYVSRSERQKKAA